MIEVLQPGITTVQDLGRHGMLDHGMPPSGVFDPFLAKVSNKLAGNEFSAPLLEFALAGPSLQFDSDCSFAIAAHSASFELNGSEVPAFRAIHASANSVLRFRSMKGWFGYIAFQGGLICEHIFGSASTYERGGIGVRLSKKGMLRPNSNHGDLCSIQIEKLQINRNRIIPILPGLHLEEFSADARRMIVENQYHISRQSDRMGIRLEGTALEAPRIRRSVPALAGTIQITSSGLPVILGPEGPVTGGYPQIGILAEVSWTALSALQPGQSLQFEWIDLNRARQLRDIRNSIFEDHDAWEII
jgi:biotin-dependent carboxylase-like uncharacterized protein